LEFSKNIAENSVAGKNRFDLFNLSSSGNTMQTALSGISRESGRKTVLKKSNRESPVIDDNLRLTKEPIPSVNEQPVKTRQQLQNETARRIETEKALNEYRWKLSAVLDNTDQPFILLDGEFKIQSFNAAAAVAVETLFGRDLIEGGPISSYIPEKYRSDFERYCIRTFRGEPVVIEKKIENDMGSERWFRFRFNPVAWGNGYNRGICLCMEDITEIKRLRESLYRSHHLQEMGLLAGQIAHDLNNLLAPLLSYPDLIRIHIPRDNVKIMEYLDRMQDSARQMAEINRDLLTWARRGNFAREDVEINAVVRKAITSVEPLPKTVEIKTELEEALPSIRGNSSQLTRAVSNLIANACDSMCGGGTLTIKAERCCTECRIGHSGMIPEGDYIRLSVSDTGGGIPPELITKIFEPFFTTKKTDNKRGSGLGLSIVNTAVKDHRGHIDIVSRIHEGTSFFLYLPVGRK
jgi:PAS domain S-box-containing protein